VNVVAPTSLDEGLEALARDRSLAVLGGGTDFMVEVNFDRRRPSSVLSLHRIAELRAWSHVDSVLTIGASVTCSTLERPEFQMLVPALSQAARTVGSPQIRNAASIGGNLGTASPAGDLLPVLSALDATIRVARTGRVRDLSIHDFLVGPKRNALEPDELITHVAVPTFGRPQEFLKVGPRNAMVIAVASVAMVRGHDDLRVALGSVGPTVVRARTAEAWIATRGFDPAAIDEFGTRVAADALPIDDHRSSAAYRSHAIRVCATRAARRVLEVAG
jgi:CO/xanthine dehydrogenase FAD-binding subunit